MALELVREVDADEKNSVKLGNVGGREEGVGWARGGGGGEGACRIRVPIAASISAFERGQIDE